MSLSSYVAEQEAALLSRGGRETDSEFEQHLSAIAGEVRRRLEEQRAALRREAMEEEKRRRRSLGGGAPVLSPVSPVPTEAVTPSVSSVGMPSPVSPVPTEAVTPSVSPVGLEAQLIEDIEDNRSPNEDIFGSELDFEFCIGLSQNLSPSSGVATVEKAMEISDESIFGADMDPHALAQASQETRVGNLSLLSVRSKQQRRILELVYCSWCYR